MICENCEEKIPNGQTFNSDDQNIFEQVMRITSENNYCVECALTLALVREAEESLLDYEDEYDDY